MGSEFVRPRKGLRALLGTGFVAVATIPAWVDRAFNIPSSWETAKTWWEKVLWLADRELIVPLLCLGLLVAINRREIRSWFIRDKMPLALGFDQDNPACVRDISEKFSSNVARLINGKQLFVQIHNLKSERVEAVNMRIEGTNPWPYPGKNPAPTTALGGALEKSEANAIDYVPIASVYYQQERGTNTLWVNTDSSPTLSVQCKDLTFSATLRLSVADASKRWEFMIYIVNDEIKARLIGRNE